MKRRRLIQGALGALACRSASADARDVFSSVRGSIVPVGTFRATDSPRFGFRGTGFAVGDGSVIATNHHVLPARAEVELFNSLAVLVAGDAGPSVRAATVLVLDAEHDLALLRLEGKPLRPLALAASELAREGQDIALVGFPVGGALGFSPVFHRGMISSVTTIALPAPSAQQLDARALMRLRAGNFSVYQLDATAYPGNSGGPMIDVLDGNVLGIVNMVLVRGSRETALSSPTGIAYAIPVHFLVQLLATR